MKTKLNQLELNSDLKEISSKELLEINGGRFGYDFGFFLRECVVYLVNGTSITGTNAVITDVAINYKPVN